MNKIVVVIIVLCVCESGREREREGGKEREREGGALIGKCEQKRECVRFPSNYCIYCALMFAH